MLIENVIQAGDIAGKAETTVVTVAPDSTVHAAVTALAEHQIGIVVVCHANGSLAGVLSERDVIRALSHDGVGILEKPVTDLMTADVQTCSPDDDPYSVIRQMNAGRFRHMPVIRDGAVVGVVSSKDIFAHMADTLSASDCQALWKQTLWV